MPISPQRSWRPGAFLAGLAVMAAVVVLSAAAGPARAAFATCQGTAQAGHPPGITLKSSDYVRFGGLSCAESRRIIRAYLSRKLHQASERCAGLAATRRGCIVEGFVCRETRRPRLIHGQSVTGQSCTRHRRTVRFRETDHSAD